MASNIAIYAGSGTTASNYAALMNSGFTTVILNSLHFKQDGSIILNVDEEVLVDANGSLTPAATELGQIVSSLKNDGGVQTVLISVGGGGAFPPNPGYINGEHSVSDGDFKSLAAGYWAADGMTSGLSNEVPILGTFATLLSTLGVDGIDLDPEPMFYSYEALASATLILTEWAQQTQGMLATWVPYTQQQSWQGMANLLQAAGASLPSWVNLQPPAWSDGDQLTSWAASLGVGVGSIVPGFDGGDPASIQSALAQVVNSGVAINGAYFWNYAQLSAGDVASYATAIEQGLAGQAPSG